MPCSVVPYYRDTRPLKFVTTDMPQNAAADLRLSMIRQWLLSQPNGIETAAESLAPASDDASFRRYFRVQVTRASRPGTDPMTTAIVMDAPPPHEDTRPFLEIAERLRAAGVSIPEIYASDTQAGLLLLQDFGSLTYLSKLNAHSADALYRDALAALVKIQAGSQVSGLPEYDRALLARELTLFPDWYVQRHRGVELDSTQRRLLDEGFSRLLDNNLAQPRVMVHRDYHSRNLMCLEPGRNPGILDFQDAVNGPITYDLVSLLRDAYIEWPEAQQIDWAVRYWQQARAVGLPVQFDFGQFWQEFEWMGLQRHLKVLGIFARLWYRDGKSRYLADMPRVASQALAVARRYQALAGLARVLERIEDAPPPKAAFTF
jgi:aminoglycoside/choline kinase family phosphotransferase